MTTSSTSDTQRKRFHLAPFGLYTRFVLVAYLRNFAIIASVLLSVALTIDLWPQMDAVMEAGGHGAARNLLVFCLLRAPGLMAPLMPFTTFLAVWLTEMAHTRSGERLFVANAGRSPLKSLCPVILLGLLAGPATFVMDGCLGPAAINEQMREHIGRDAQRLDRSQTSSTIWIESRKGLISTRIAYGPPATLHDLSFYRFDNNFQLVEIDMAPIAQYDRATGLWHLMKPSTWSGDAFSPTLVTPLPDAEISRDLGIFPPWLSAYGIEVQYLPIRTLRTLSRHGGEGYDAAPYKTRLATLYAAFLLPGAMALMAYVLSATLIPYTVTANRAARVLAWGYGAHATTRVCVLLGQTGVIPAWLAGGFVPCAALAITAYTLWKTERAA
ncbi:LptF/LptG family permease [Acetobacter suratthaniensis]|uniref:LptF/LptG family permease n=1 Tax=Acetobacter suratthaniensis TaxID=1502841 RepID=A0ABS3LKW4_9PROT|nr:LptF/LptG family permease [Acetobacter suratthaniensis]MBO1327795.1 LptF/LptG family permease [Acetobacter suratthaniensis]MCX2566025.1 LptF/LptG family permease [Acetobacter suratthaniensis]